MQNNERKEAISEYMELLSIHRSNLRKFLQQKAQHGLVPPLIVLNGIRQEKSEILSIKKALYKLGHSVDDLPDEPQFDIGDGSPTHNTFTRFLNTKETNSPFHQDERTVGAGFDALRELMQLKEVREEVSSLRADLRLARRYITLIAIYKKLHDDFQKLESSYNTIYYFIYRNNQLVQMDSSLWESFERSEPELQTHITNLLQGMENPEVAVEQGAWQQKLKRASNDLKVATEKLSEDRLKRGTKAIKDILGTQPSRINDQMRGLIRGLREMQPGGKVEMLRDRLLQLHLNANEQRLVTRFQAGIEALIRLNGQIDHIMDIHNDFQEIDNQLRWIEIRIEENISDLVSAWVDVEWYSNKLCDKNKERWSLQLASLTTELHNALDNDTSQEIIRCFRKYRSHASRSFNEVDNGLLNLCNSLMSIGDSIDPILEML